MTGRGARIAVSLALIVAMVVLHQDTWLWRDARLVFGFLPAGLAYHAAFSVVTAIVMAVLVKIAWPEPQPDDDDEGARDEGGAAR